MTGVKFPSLVLAFLPIYLFAQTEGYEHHFLQGINLAEQGELAKAEVAFSNAINAHPAKDALFNRGIVRKFLDDTCGYCNDMYRVHEFYNDPIAFQELTKNCIMSSDTTYYNKKDEQVTSSDKVRFQDIIIKNTCQVDQFGFIKDTKYQHEKFVYAGKSPINGAMWIKTNIIAKFRVENGERIYYYLKHVNRGFIKGQQDEKNYQELIDLINSELNTSRLHVSKVPISVIVHGDGTTSTFSSQIREVSPNNFNHLRFEELAFKWIKENVTFPENEILGKKISVSHGIILEF